VIRKKVAPPKGPPPAGMASFKGPKKIDSDDNDRRDGYERDMRRYEDEYNDVKGSRNMRSYSEEEDMQYHRGRDARDYHGRDEREQRSRDERDQRSSERDERGREERDRRRKDDNEEPYHGAPDKERRHGMSDEAAEDKSRRSYAEEDMHHENKSDTQSVRTADTGKDKIFMFRRVLRASFRDLRTFVTTPCEPKTVVRCYVERNRSGSNYFSPVYSLCADLEDGTGRELITCRKVFKSRTAHYIFSLKSEDLYRKREQRSRMYVGKLRAVSETEYVLYDNGVCDTVRHSESIDTADETLDGIENEIDEDYEDEAGSNTPSAVGRNVSAATGHDDDSSLYRSHLAVIQYNSRVRPTEMNERGMEVCIPQVAAVFPPGGEGGMAAAPTPVVAKCTDLVHKFRKIRETGRQNDMYQSNVFVMHEKRSRYETENCCT
jgi:hypothetical protein